MHYSVSVSTLIVASVHCGEVYMRFACSMSYVLSEDPTYASKINISVLLITPLSARFRLYIKPPNVRQVLNPQVLGTVQNSPLILSHVLLLQLKHAILHPRYCLRRRNPLRAGI